MHRILICPGERPALAFLSQSLPLVAVPIFGENLLVYWLERLAGTGTKEVSLVVTDRPDLVRSLVGDGSRWGVRVRVQVELTELTPAEICRKFAHEERPVAVTAEDLILLDHLPGQEAMPLFQTYRHWFAALMAWMPQAASPQRIGLREIQPQVWCGRRAHVAPGAKLQAPCWLGDHVQVGSEASIGPQVILESGVVVDRAAEVRSSIVGPDTFVGALTRIENSIAWGNTLIDWRSGSCTQVPDPFLLCALGQRYLPEAPRNGRGSFGQNLVDLLTRPLRTGDSNQMHS